MLDTAGVWSPLQLLLHLAVLAPRKTCCCAQSHPQHPMWATMEAVARCQSNALSTQGPRPVCVSGSHAVADASSGPVPSSASSYGPSLGAALNQCWLAAGCNAGTVPGQWSYSLGPCSGIQLGDQLWLSRYLLMRCAERQRVIASLDPMPVPGNWSGCGAAIQYR